MDNTRTHLAITIIGAVLLTVLIMPVVMKLHEATVSGWLDVVYAMAGQ